MKCFCIGQTKILLLICIHETIHGISLVERHSSWASLLLYERRQPSSQAVYAAVTCTWVKHLEEMNPSEYAVTLSPPTCIMHTK